MAAAPPTPFFFSNFTPPHFSYLLLLLLLIFFSFPILTLPLNLTHLLSPFPDLSQFTSLLASSAVSAADLSSFPALTILTVPNSHLHPPPPPSPFLPDLLRYHVLLQYLSLSDLRRLPPSGYLVPTLFQTTGRAAPNSGSVNITFDPDSSTVTFRSPASNATLLSDVETLAGNNSNISVSILSLDSLLIPYDLNLMASSETRPPLGLNITETLINGHNFNVAASMLAASGLVAEFQADEAGAGITLFAPTDGAFADLPPSVRFQSLPADKKAVVLRFHVLHSYYPLGSLQSIVNPVYPTLATEQNGAGSFTVNISRVNGSATIDTGIVQAVITQTVIDQNPVAIFGVSKVLLPKEFFGKNPIEINDPDYGSGVIGGAQPPEIALPPLDAPPSHLSSPPGLELRSAASPLRLPLCWWCIMLCYLIRHI